MPKSVPIHLVGEGKARSVADNSLTYGICMIPIKTIPLTHRPVKHAQLESIIPFISLSCLISPGKLAPYYFLFVSELMGRESLMSGEREQTHKEGVAAGLFVIMLTSWPGALASFVRHQ